MKSSIAVIVLAALTACDPFVGPKFQNGFGKEVSIAVKFSDGTSWTHAWLPCRTTFIGKIDSEVTHVSIVENGKEVMTVESTRIHELKEIASDTRQDTVWQVDSSGIHRVLAGC